MTTTIAPDASVLVINVARIGDTLMTTPVLRAIRAAYPEARVGCLAHPKRAAVLEGLEWVNSLGTITPKIARWRGLLHKKQTPSGEPGAYKARGERSRTRVIYLCRVFDFFV